MKKILAIALVFVLCFTFFACGDENNKGSTTTQNNTTTTTENNTTTTTIPPTLTEQDALQIATDLISRLDECSVYGTACSFEDVKGDEAKNTIDSIKASLTAEQKDMLSVAYLKKCTCCSTYDQAIKHTLTFFDESLVNDLYAENYVEYNGSLYFMLLPTGYPYHNNVTIRSFDSDLIIAQADLLGDFDEPVPPSIFTIEKVDGSYKITSIEDL